MAERSTVTKRLVVAAVALVLLSLADLTLTRIAIDHFYAIEGNAVVAPIVQTNLGWWVKGAFVAFVAASAVIAAKERWIRNLFYGVTMLYALVVAYTLGAMLWVGSS